MSRGFVPAGPKRKIAREKLPEYAKRILDLRGTTKQGEFAKNLKVSPMAVSHWENGTNEPGSKMYLKLATQAEGEARQWFMLRAKSETIDLALEAFSPAQSSKSGPDISNERALRHHFVPVALVAGFAGAGSARLQDDDQVEGMLTLPRDLIPNPTETKCIRVSGESMMPTISPSAVAAVDRSQRRVEKLLGKVVAAYHEMEGLVVKRLVHVEGHYRLASDNVGYAPLDLENGWQIMGRVVWWIHTA